MPSPRSRLHCRHHPARRPLGVDLAQKALPPLPEHFHFGTHPAHGFVATATAHLPAHLAHWFLTREQFEPVPDRTGLYRLSDPDRDGRRRTRQAVHDLRRHGYTVQADYTLDPAMTPGPPHSLGHRGLAERRSQIAQAAATPSPQQSPALRTSPGARSIPPRPTHAPAVGTVQPARPGRSGRT
ncbi:hypothetical protein ABT104_13100 [Streptomyces mobaraensis]|uniref:hypothetical protein n=1 Tax=Streptomyces mobaraensis TaxID=35621 RepID=UPI003326682B